MGDKRPRLRNLGSRIRTLDTRTAKPPAKTVDPVYRTPEYHRWRTIVLQRAAGYCQDQEHEGPNPWPGRLLPDHIKEVKDGGALDDPANGMARCDPCHTRKTNRERQQRHRAGGWPES